MLGVVSRHEAIGQNLPRFFTGRPCRRGHLAERRVDGGHCIECQRITQAGFHARHPTRNAQYHRKYYAGHKDEYKAEVMRRRRENLEQYNSTRRRWYAANAEREATRAREWRKLHPPTPAQRKAAIERATAHAKRTPDRRREINSAWQKRNPGKVNSQTAKRRAARERATPPWVDLVAVGAFYEAAAQVTRMTGTPYEVDHIEPLLGRTARGLHVPWNLRVIPRV